MNFTSTHPQKFRRLKASFTYPEQLHAQINSCPLSKCINAYVVDPKNQQIFLALNEQKDWKFTKTLDFLDDITHWQSNEALEKFAQKHGFKLFPLKEELKEMDNVESSKVLLHSKSAPLEREKEEIIDINDKKKPVVLVNSKSSILPLSKKIQKFRKLLSFRREQETPKRIAKRKELESETPEVNESRCEFWKTVIKGGEMDLCDLVSIASERNGVDWCCAFLKKNTELLPLNREIKVKNTRRKNSVKNWDSLF